jgi:hypothetical protein
MYKNLVDQGHTSKLMAFEIHQHNSAAVSHYRSGTGRRRRQYLPLHKRRYFGCQVSLELRVTHFKIVNELLCQSLDIAHID